MILQARPISRARRLRFRTASPRCTASTTDAAPTAPAPSSIRMSMTRLEGCFTTVEKRMIAEGAFLQVRETRTMFQDWMRPRFTEIVEDATGRRVAAFFSQVSHDPDMALETFLLEQAGSGPGGRWQAGSTSCEGRGRIPHGVQAPRGAGTSGLSRAPRR